MKVNLKFKAMSILLAGLPDTQMLAIYHMGMGDEIPASVTKADLTSIIAFLFKELDWIEHQESACQLLSSASTEISKKGDDVDSQDTQR